MERKTDSLLKDSGGQATTEYILLLSIIVGVYVSATSAINRFRLAELLTKPIMGPFAAAYRYGHPLAKGYDDGGPKYHPRATGENSFRLFLNSDAN